MNRVEEGSSRVVTAHNRRNPRWCLAHCRRKALILGACIVFAGIGAAQISAALNVAVFGGHYLEYGNCCNGVTLDGTRAYITVSSASPQYDGCMIFASFVTSLVDAGQLETGDVLCDASTSLDGTCSLSDNFVKFVERSPHDGSPAVCYPHGNNFFNTANFFTLQNIGGNGTWYAYIDGDQKEGQSGYTNGVRISESGENSQRNDYSCAGWSGSATFSSWQRDNYSTHTWSTVQSAQTFNTNNCWSVGGVSNGTFSVGH
jgi:hypothetical protein